MASPTGPAGPSGGGTIMGIPTRWAIIGAGGAALALFLFTRKGSGGGQQQSGDILTGGTYGDSLGPHAALALGSLENQLLQQSGIIQEQSERWGDSLQSLLDSQATQLSDLGAGLTGARGMLSDIGTDVMDFRLQDAALWMMTRRDELIRNDPAQTEAYNKWYQDWYDSVRAGFDSYTREAFGQTATDRTP